MYQQECMFTCGVIRLASKTLTLDNNDLVLLRKIYDSLPPLNAARDFNLFSVIKKEIGNNEAFKPIADKLRKQCNKRDITHYFLLYKQDSFCALHQDSPKRVTSTGITLVDRSDDLDGGDIIITSTIEELNLGLHGNVHRPTDDDILSKKEPVPITSKTKVIEVVKQEVGETVWYPAQKMHGVSLVKKGYRLVLISWYKDNEKDQIHKETI